MISVHFQGKSFSIRAIQVYGLTSNAEEVEVEQFYEDPQGLLELTPQNMSFYYRGLECKVGSQDILGVTSKCDPEVQNEAGQRLIEFFQENSVVIANILFQKHKR